MFTTCSFQAERALLAQQNAFRLALASSTKDALQSGEIDNLRKLLSPHPYRTALWSSDLYEAVEKNHVKLVELFLQYGDFTSFNDGYDFQDAIQAAILNNNLEIVKLLVQHDVGFSTPTLNITDDFVKTAPLSDTKELSNVIGHKISPLRFAGILKRTEINNYLSETRIKNNTSIARIIHPEEHASTETSNTVATPRP